MLFTNRNTKNPGKLANARPTSLRLNAVYKTGTITAGTSNRYPKRKKGLTKIDNIGNNTMYARDATVASQSDTATIIRRKGTSNKPFQWS